MFTTRRLLFHTSSSISNVRRVRTLYRSFSQVVSLRQEKEEEEEQVALEEETNIVEERLKSEVVEEMPQKEVGNRKRRVDPDAAQRSSFFSTLIDSERKEIEEEPINFAEKNYERIKQYVDAMDEQAKKEDEDEDYRYQDPMKPRKNSTFAKLISKWDMSSQEDILNFFGFERYATVVTKEIIEELRTLPNHISNHYLIDVRGRLSAKFYQIPGAVNIPLKEIVAAFELLDDDFKRRYGVPKPDTMSNLIFFSEDMIETELACVLVSTLTDGYKLVYNYRGGVQDWFGSTYKQVWRRSFVSDYNILSRHDQYGSIKSEMLQLATKLQNGE